MTTSAPDLLERVLFCVGCRGRDHERRAECLGELHCDQSDRGRRANNEDAVTGREPRLRDERVVFGGQSDRQCGGLAPGRRFRQRDRVTAVEQRELRERAEPGPADLVTHADRRDVGTHRSHLAGRLKARGVHAAGLGVRVV